MSFERHSSLTDFTQLLRERVQIRAPCGQPDGRDANRLDGPLERLAKLRVPVVNEVSARGQKADI